MLMTSNHMYPEFSSSIKHMRSIISALMYEYKSSKIKKPAATIEFIIES